MTTEHQSYALCLATWLEQSARLYDPADVKECAAELRRLQAENEALRTQVEAPTPPAPWSIAFDAWWADNRVATHKVHSAEGLARKAFHAGSIKGQKGGA